jgi:hypothetical protein
VIRASSLVGRAARDTFAEKVGASVSEVVWINRKVKLTIRVEDGGKC